MKTLEQIKDICSEQNICKIDEEEEYRIFDKYSSLLEEAWKEWSDDVTRKFWEGDEKPESPTESFRENYFNNFDFEEVFEHRLICA